jgi:ABC-2 type transport system ATP-binding protein
LNIIEISRLTRDYGGGRGVFDLSFSIPKGEVFGFLGPNGAGKTTTIRHLMGFVKPEKGKLSIGGLDCWQKASDIQKKLGYIPGEMAFPEDMTGIGFLRFMAEYRGQKDFTRAEKLMEQFELNPKGKLKKMSKGMKQKVGIICAFMHDPDVLLLDEPTSGLDPLMQNRFIDLILEEKQRGKTILMSSHLFEEVERTCDRIGILKAGHLAAVEDTASLNARKQRSYTVTLSDEEAAKSFALEKLNVASRDKNRVTVTVRQDMQAFIQAMARYPVINIDVAEQSLEEIFLHYYGGNGK